MFGVAEDVRPAMRQARADNQAFVLATLVAVDGGGPRPRGTQMVFAPGVLAGYFSGGCVEGDVAGHAWACLEDARPRTLSTATAARGRTSICCAGPGSRSSWSACHRTTPRWRCCWPLRPSADR